MEESTQEDEETDGFDCFEIRLFESWWERFIIVCIVVIVICLLPIIGTVIGIYWISRKLGWIHDDD